MTPDQAGNPMMRSLTQDMKLVLSKVLGPPQEQLEVETRKQLIELVEYINQQGQ